MGTNEPSKLTDSGNHPIVSNRHHKYRYCTAMTQLNKVKWKTIVLWCLWLPLHSPCMTLEDSLQRAGISCMLVYPEGDPGEKSLEQS